MKSRKIMIPILLFVASILLVGCDSPSQRAEKELEAEVQFLIAQVKSKENSWLAFKQLSQGLTELSKKRNCDVFGRCPEAPVWKTASDLRLELLKSAVQEKSHAALILIYSKDAGDYQDFWRNEYQSLKKSYVQNVFDYVDKQKGISSDDSELLKIAGDLCASGDEVIQDTNKAVTYYARAWAAGRTQAAASASEMFLSMNDVRNSYLWSLRCIGACNRSYEISLDNLQKSLTPAAIQQAQKAAAAPSIIELDTSGS